MSAPFVWILLSFAAGVLCSRSIHFPEWMLIPSFAVAFAAFHYSSFKIALSSGLLLIMFLAIGIMQKEDERYEQNELRGFVQLREKETVAIQGTLMRTPELSADYFVLQLRVESVSGTDCRGISRLTVTGEPREALIVGDQIQSFARMRLPKNFRTPGAFNYERYLRAQGVHVLGTIKDARLIHKMRGKRSFISYFSAIRLKWIRDTIQNFSPQDAGLLRALWLDDRGGISQSQERILVDAGIFHVIAISGFHISVLLVILFFAFKKLISFRWSIALACLFLFFYFLILEGRSSVTRSFLSFLILAFAIWKYEQIRLANWICLSAFNQLVLNPQELYDSGFQLTYLSTATIVFLVIPVCRRFKALPRRYRYILNFAAAGAVVQIVLVPYQIYLFHRIPLFTFFANIVAVPLSSVLIASSTLLMPIPMLANLLRQSVQVTIAGLMGSASLFADHGVRIMPTPPSYWITAFYCSLCLAIIVTRQRLKVSFFFLTFLFLTLIVCPRQPERTGALQVHFLDVGQGDAILVEYPDGTFDLVDGGGFFNLEALDTGQAILIPYLCRMGVTKLHRVFLTHAHADHMNGLLSLMRYIPVDEFYVTRQPVGAKNYQYLVMRNF